MRRLLRGLELHSVCEEARCPNLPRCFARGTVTVMLLGDVCTRACRFCNVATGRPRSVDRDEPDRVAQAVAALRLDHVVLTSVNRDDLEDQGSGQFSATIHAVRERSSCTTVEVLTPDFRGDADCIDRVAAARPDVYNHNVETVPRLYRRVRPGAVYRRSLELLERVKARDRTTWTKSGLMLGMGEEPHEVVEVLRDLRAVRVDALTLGQYLRPTLRHLPVHRYVEPGEFEELRRRAWALGFSSVSSGPLVRSSFLADEALLGLRLAEGA
jgi:lipoic acid synthetase